MITSEVIDSMFLSSITKDGIGSRDSKSAANPLSDPIPYFYHFNFEIESKNKKVIVFQMIISQSYK